MTGLVFLILAGLYAFLCIGFRESSDITKAAPSAPPTTDDYEEDFDV